MEKHTRSQEEQGVEQCLHLEEIYSDKVEELWKVDMQTKHGTGDWK
jgi:hypothetical protein